MENQGEGFAGNDQLSEELEQVFQEEPIRKDDDDDDDDESTPEEDETWNDFSDDPMRVIYGIIGYATHVEERFPSDLAGDVQARERWILIGRKRDVALVPFDPKTEFNRTPTPMESILEIDADISFKPMSNHLALWGLMGPSQGCTLHRRLYVPPPAPQASGFGLSAREVPSHCYVTFFSGSWK